MSEVQQVVVGWMWTARGASIERRSTGGEMLLPKRKMSRLIL